MHVASLVSLIYKVQYVAGRRESLQRGCRAHKITSYYGTGKNSFSKKQDLSNTSPIRRSRLQDFEVKKKRPMHKNFLHLTISQNE
jgi:hypothetical protein